MNLLEGQTDSLTGLWEGSFEFQGRKVEMAVDFNSNMISIPEQGLSDYPVIDIKHSKQRITFAVALGGKVEFAGTVDGGTIRGTFRQTGAEGAFMLAIAGKSRAQSYSPAGTGSPTRDESGLCAPREDVSVTRDGVTLYGTLTLPDQKGPVPAVLIIAGSGPTDRDGNSHLLPGKNDSLRMLAEGLAANGIAAVRYDKRGVAASAGKEIDESKSTFDLFVNDAAAWIEKLQTDSRFSDLGIIGHSEGSLIGMLAARRTNIQAFVSIAGSGQPIHKILLDQLRVRVPGSVEEASAIIESLIQGKIVAEVSPQLLPVFRPGVQPFLISMFSYDPAEVISQINIPMLIVNGSRDLQTDVTNARLLSAAQMNAALIIIDRMNHVLKEAPLDQQGNIATYSNPNLPLARGLIEAVGGFLQIHL